MTALDMESFSDSMQALSRRFGELRRAIAEVGLFPALYHVTSSSFDICPLCGLPRRSISVDGITEEGLFDISEEVKAVVWAEKRKQAARGAYDASLNRLDETTVARDRAFEKLIAVMREHGIAPNSLPISMRVDCITYTIDRGGVSKVLEIGGNDD